MSYIDNINGAVESDKLLRIGLQFFGEGANGQSAAASAPAAAGTGANGQGSAASADDTSDDLDGLFDDENDEGGDDDVNGDDLTDDEGADGGDDSGTDGKPADNSAPVDDKTRNAIYADARRAAERDALRRADQTAQKKADESIAALHLRDPYTNREITSLKDFEAYQSKHQSETVTSELGKAGISQEAIDTLISNHPAVKKATEAAQAFEQEQTRIRNERAADTFKSEIKAIGELDPDANIKTYEDLRKLPEYDKIYDYVKRGSTISDAYKLTYFDKLSQKAADKASQSTRNNINSKAHMQSVVQRGKGGIVVPPEIFAEARELDPDATDAEIRRDYARYQKSKK